MPFASSKRYLLAPDRIASLVVGNVVSRGLRTAVAALAALLCRHRLLGLTDRALLSFQHANRRCGWHAICAGRTAVCFVQVAESVEREHQSLDAGRTII